MARLQIISSTTIILVAIGIIAILVNLVPEFKYTDNIFSLMEFNVFCIVLLLMGGLGLVFLIDPNIYNGFKMKGCLEWVIGKSKMFGYMLRVLLSMTAVLMVLSPAIGGVIFSTCQTYIADCEALPCMHGGTCTEPGPGNFTCTCAQGWEVPRCERDVDECEAGPCARGSCINTVS